MDQAQTQAAHCAWGAWPRCAWCGPAFGRTGDGGVVCALDVLPRPYLFFAAALSACDMVAWRPPCCVQCCVNLVIRLHGVHQVMDRMWCAGGVLSGSRCAACRLWSWGLLCSQCVSACAVWLLRPPDDCPRGLLQQHPTGSQFRFRAY